MRRILVAFVAAVVFGAPASVGQTSATNTREVFAVCISHVGEQDKFMTPIIIAVNARSESACRKVINGQEGIGLAWTIRVSNERLTAIADRVREAVSTKSVPNRCHAFGTFGWTILKGVKKTEALTCPEESVKLLTDLQKLSKDEELGNALQNSLTYIGAAN